MRLWAAGAARNPRPAGDGNNPSQTSRTGTRTHRHLSLASAPSTPSLGAAESGLQRMPTDPCAPHAHSTCPFARRHGQCTHLHTAQVTRHAGIPAVDQWPHLACHNLLSFCSLLSTQESSAASQKCRFRVRHFGRVFVLPYEYTTAQ